MKIRDLSATQKEHFKNNVNLYMAFFQNKCPQLSNYSHSMYARALSYIAVENNLNDLLPEELAIALTKDILTTSDFIKIVGSDSGSNQNIRLSAFRNLVNPFKDKLQSNISEVSYSTLSKLLSRKGCHIRKTLLESKKKNIKTELELMNSRSWKDLQNVVQTMNKKYNQVMAKFLKTNEIPDYVTLRNILIANLYMFNSHEYQGLTVHVIMKNEYRTAFLWLSDKEPPQDKNHYFWINHETNQHYFVINRVKAMSGVKETIKKRKMFVLNKTIVNMIIFIKQTFNENIDKPFFKNNVRETTMYSTDWIRIVNKIFETVANGICSTTLKTVYMNEIDWSKISTEQISYICYNLDQSKKNTSMIHETHSYSPEQPSSDEEQAETPSPASVLVF